MCMLFVLFCFSGVKSNLESNGQGGVKLTPTQQLIQEMENDDDSRSSTCSSDRSSPPSTRRTSLPLRRQPETTNGSTPTSWNRSGSTPMVRSEVHVKTGSPYISPMASPSSSTTSGSNYGEEDFFDGMCAPVKVQVFGNESRQANTTIRTIQ